MTDDPLILGIDATREGGACLLRGNRVVVGIKEERLSRVEGDPVHASRPFLALRYCCDVAGMETRNVDLVVCRADGPPDEWPHDITLNSELRIARNGLDWMTLTPESETLRSLPDAGVSAALRGLEERFPGRFSRPHISARASGRSYDADEMLAAVEALPALIRLAPGDDVAEAIADRLAAGRTVGWFQGPSCAVGDGRPERMLLSGARSNHLRAGAQVAVTPAGGDTMLFDILLSAEDVEEWCELPVEGDVGGPGPRRMRFLRACQHRLPPALRGPDVCSVVIAQPDDAHLLQLLRSVGERTGQPFAYCAPFRAAGEPVVETPTDALWTLLQLQLDACMLDGVLVERRDPAATLLELVPAVNDWECTISGDCRGRQVDESLAGKTVAVEVSTPWGSAIRVLNPLQLVLVGAIDGRTNGRQLLERVNGSNRTRISAAWLQSALAELRRLGIITLEVAAESPGRGWGR
ncbi:MAG: hypothetical protein PVJ49_19475 [Acidobacteriota bacterium]|jgi:hypothetical protein